MATFYATKFISEFCHIACIRSRMPVPSFFLLRILHADHAAFSIKNLNFGVKYDLQAKESRSLENKFLLFVPATKKAERKNKRNLMKLIIHKWNFPIFRHILFLFVFVPFCKGREGTGGRLRIIRQRAGISCDWIRAKTINFKDCFVVDALSNVAYRSVQSFILRNVTLPSPSFYELCKKREELKEISFSTENFIFNKFRKQLREIKCEKFHFRSRRTRSERQPISIWRFAQHHLAFRWNCQNTCLVPNELS